MGKRRIIARPTEACEVSFQRHYGFLFSVYTGLAMRGLVGFPMLVAGSVVLKATERRREIRTFPEIV
jgi:hypothetical protein